MTYHIKNYRRDLIVVDDREKNIELNIGLLEDQNLYGFYLFILFFDNLYYYYSIPRDTFHPRLKNSRNSQEVCTYYMIDF